MKTVVSRTSGFTVLELLITIFIVSLIILSASFVFKNQLLGNLDGDSQLIATRLSEAQTRALSTLGGTSWGIHFDNSSTPATYALFQGSSYVAASTTYYLSNLVEFRTPAVGTTTDIIFAKRAGTVPTTSTIVLDLKNSTSDIKTITVSAQGNITVQ